MQPGSQVQAPIEMRPHGGSPQRKQHTPGPQDAADSLRRKEPLLAAVLEKASQREGCLVCCALRDVEARTLFSFLYEGITAPSTREEFVRGGGFCPRHFRTVLRQTKAQGYVGPFEVGSVCQLLINAAADKIPKAKRTRSSNGWPGLRKNQPTEAPGGPGDKCMFCADSRSKERDVVLALESLIADQGIANHLGTNGLCERHGSMAMLRWKTAENREWLGRVLSRQIETLKSDLKEFLRKHDYRFRKEPPGGEADVLRRALEFLLGLEAAAEEKGR